jgi:hypothetical protein
LWQSNLLDLTRFSFPDEHAFFFFGRFATFRVESVDKLDCREIVAAFSL